MVINNKISPFLTGPYIFFGLIFIPGIVIGVSGLDWKIIGINTVIAWYLFGTFSGVIINTETRKFKAYNKHFGLFSTGRWHHLNNYIGITLVPMKQVYTMYSRSNRINSSEKEEFRIYLVNRAKKPAVEIKKCKSMEEGQKSIDEFSIWLKMKVFSVAHK